MRATHYAQALHELATSATLDEEKLVHQFINTVSANGDQHLLPRIVKEYERRAARAGKEQMIEVVSATELSEDAVAKLLKSEPYKRVLLPKHKKVLRRTDETLVGGAVVSVSGTRVDGSYKRALVDLYQQLISA